MDPLRIEKLREAIDSLANQTKIRVFTAPADAPKTRASFHIMILAIN